jgi:uncharacterized protein YbjT (DUF2867 family)
VPLYRPDALAAPIHERDIAAVAVAALTGNDATTGLLTGPARMNQRDQVAAISAVIGTDLTVTAPSTSSAGPRSPSPPGRPTTPPTSPGHGRLKRVQ